MCNDCAIALQPGFRDRASPRSSRFPTNRIALRLCGRTVNWTGLPCRLDIQYPIMLVMGSIYDRSARRPVPAALEWTAYSRLEWRTRSRAHVADVDDTSASVLSPAGSFRREPGGWSCPQKGIKLKRSFLRSSHKHQYRVLCARRATVSCVCTRWTCCVCFFVVR